jgi:hypothetical protein
MQPRSCTGESFFLRNRQECLQLSDVHRNLLIDALSRANSINIIYQLEKNNKFAL